MSTAGPLDLIADSVAACLREHGLTVDVHSLGDAKGLAVLAYRPGNSIRSDIAPLDHSNHRPGCWHDRIAVVFSTDPDDPQVSYDVYVDESKIYQKTCSWQDFDPESAIPKLVTVLQKGL